MDTTFASERLEDIEEYRIRASRLLKALRGPDEAAAVRAEERLRQLPQVAGLLRDDLRRKHALAVIAREAGYAGWLELKAAIEEKSVFDPARLVDRPTGGFINLWYRSYEEARAVLDGETRRFLFPYRSQFFVCEAGLIETAGVDPFDADWDRMGRDWVKPSDAAARGRLALLLRQSLR
ncbi:MAG: hypothetical protein ABI972_00725 [Acidobacteriota bacterium]